MDPASHLIDSVSKIEGITQVRMLRPSMMVVTTHIEGGPRPEESVETVNEEGLQRRENIS